MEATVKQVVGLREPKDLPGAVCGPSCGPEGLSEDEANRLAEVFAALGDPARLRIYSLICCAEEVCSCSLEGPLSRSQSTISHHTSKLAAAGLIEGERRGRWTWWRANRDVATEFGLDGFLTPSC